jgi:hypothetical protein
MIPLLAKQISLDSPFKLLVSLAGPGIGSHLSTTSYLQRNKLLTTGYIHSLSKVTGSGFLPNLCTYYTHLTGFVKDGMSPWVLSSICTHSLAVLVPSSGCIPSYAGHVEGENVAVVRQAAAGGIALHLLYPSHQPKGKFSHSFILYICIYVNIHTHIYLHHINMYTQQYNIPVRYIYIYRRYIYI